MKLKFYNPADLGKNLKATIHRTGKLGFTSDAANKLSLSKDCSVGIASNEDDPEDKNLYLIVYPTQRPLAFPVNKAGQYFYVNTKMLFDTLKIDYSEGNVSYEIKIENIDDAIVYVLKPRPIKEKVVTVDTDELPF